MHLGTQYSKKSAIIIGKKFEILEKEKPQLKKNLEQKKSSNLCENILNLMKKYLDLAGP